MAQSMKNDAIAKLLHEAAESHLDIDHAAGDSDEPWPIYYTRRLRERFGPA